jgi:hypothetical protein
MRWRKAADIRTYVEAVRVALRDAAEVEAFNAWSAWALAEAARLDPIDSGRALQVLRQNGMAGLSIA